MRYTTLRARMLLLGLVIGIACIVPGGGTSAHAASSLPPPDAVETYQQNMILFSNSDVLRHAHTLVSRRGMRMTELTTRHDTPTEVTYYLRYSGQDQAAVSFAFEVRMRRGAPASESQILSVGDPVPVSR